MLDASESRNKRVKHFTDLDVWQKAHELFLVVVKDLEGLVNKKMSYVIGDQILRSVSAVSANIAEGFNARTTNHYLSFLDIAKRSAAESENWFYKLQDLGYLEKEIAAERIQTCLKICRMLSGLMKSLGRNRR